MCSIRCDFLLISLLQDLHCHRNIPSLLEIFRVKRSRIVLRSDSPGKQRSIKIQKTDWFPCNIFLSVARINDKFNTAQIKLENLLLLPVILCHMVSNVFPRFSQITTAMRANKENMRKVFGFNMFHKVNFLLISHVTLRTPPAYSILLQILLVQCLSFCWRQKYVTSFIK